MMNSAPWRIAVCAVLLVSFAWPALYNGQAIFFPDTTAYIRGADAGIQAALHHRSRWSAPAAGSPAPATGPAATSGLLKDKTVMTGRSPYYGALLYLGDFLGGFWASILLQSAAVLAAVILTLRALRVPFSNLPAIGAVLILASSLPFFVSFLMPDIFTGIVILGAAVLLSTSDRLSRSELVTWLVLLVAGATFHDSHVLIMAAMLGLAVVRAALRRDWAQRIGLGTLLLALLVSFAAQTLVGAAVKHSVGAPPLRPPFLMARLIEDGPGYDYLRSSCPASGFEVCAFVARLPLTADEFLWNPQRGVFAAASAETRRRLSAEQFHFMRAVIAHEPGRQLAISLRNAALQFFSVGLWEFNYAVDEKVTFEGKVPEEPLAQMHRSAAFRGTMPVGTFGPVIATVFYLSFLYVLVVLSWSRTRVALTPAARAVAGWTVLAVCINALVCGVLSGPHDRYATRLEWIVPFIAILIAMTLRARNARPVSRAGARPQV